jgi:hypothetical protein
MLPSVLESFSYTELADFFFLFLFCRSRVKLFFQQFLPPAKSLQHLQRVGLHPEAGIDAPRLFQPTVAVRNQNFYEAAVSANALACKVNVEVHVRDDLPKFADVSPDGAQ